MRFRTKAAIMTALAGPAIAGLILTGAGPANAAATTTTAQTSNTWMPPFQFCSPWNLERWDFRGNNTVDVTFGTTPYTYAVHFDQRGSCLSGWLTDTHIPAGNPQTGPIHGYVFRNYVKFSFTYTYTGETQGTRTYTGTVNRWGWVSGTWSDSTDSASGTWSLAHGVRPACPQWGPWYGFFAFGNGCPVPFPYWWYY